MAQSLSVTGITTGGKKSSKTLTYINPEATNAQLQNLAVAYNALSNKTYDGGERTIKQNINDPDPTPGKLNPEMTVGTWGLPDTTTLRATVTVNIPSSEIKIETLSGSMTATITIQSENQIKIVAGKSTRILLYAEETENHYALAKEIQVPAS